MALAKLFAANITQTTVPTPGFSDAVPVDATGTKVLALTGNVDSIRLYPYGIGSADNTFSIYVFRWLSSADPDYLAYPVGIYTATLGTAAGASGKIITNSELIVDTIAVTSSSGDGSGVIASGAANGGALLTIPFSRANYLQVTLVKGTCTSCNCLYELFNS